MRVKKQKQLRRHVRFYKTCFGFREPFKVLCDGTFVHYCLTQKIGSLQDSLSTILGAPAKPMVTRCVIAELKKLGETYSGTALAARRLNLAKCEHEPPLPAGECVATMVGSHNVEHFFVGTQDLELRKRLRKVHGGALIYARNTSLVLEPPSEKQQEYAKMGEAEWNRLTERERRLLEIRQQKHSKKENGEEKPKDDVTADGMLKAEDAATTPANQSMIVKKPSKGLGVADRPSFKRKHVKGPNPLSVKKKQNKVVAKTSSDQKALVVEAGTDTQPKKQKVRRRSRKRKSGAENGADHVDNSAAS